MNTVIRNLAGQIKTASVTEGFAPTNIFNPSDVIGDLGKTGLKLLGLGALGEKANEIENAFDAVYSLGGSVGGRRFEKATRGVDPRIVPRLESYDRTFARELGVDKVPVVRGMRAAAFSVRPRYDGALNQLQLPTMDTPVNVTKQLGRAAVDLSPDNPLAVRLGKRVIPRATTGFAAGLAGAIPGVIAGTALGGPVGGVIGGAAGFGLAGQGAMTGVHYAASKAADDVVRRKLAPVATKQFLDNYGKATRISRRGLIGKNLPMLAMFAALPAAYYMQNPLQARVRDTADNWLNVPERADQLQGMLEQNSFGRSLLDYSANR
jgi:hypothetical protein